MLLLSALMGELIIRAPELLLFGKKMEMHHLVLRPIWTWYDDGGHEGVEVGSRTSAYPYHEDLTSQIVVDRALAAVWRE